jgi:hypothetical protein
VVGRAYFGGVGNIRLAWSQTLAATLPAPNRPSCRCSWHELIINLKTASMIGLAVPPSLIALADEVIE